LYKIGLQTIKRIETDIVLDHLYKSGLSKCVKDIDNNLYHVFGRKLIFVDKNVDKVFDIHSARFQNIYYSTNEGTYYWNRKINKNVKLFDFPVIDLIASETFDGGLRVSFIINPKEN
jgi:hypothetical protein